MLIEMDKLEAQQAHDLLTSAIIPRPIAWVSTVSLLGEHNLAPFSFFTGITWRPATLGISIVNRADGTEKDTLRNIRQTREFVVNSVCVEQGSLMFKTAQMLPYGTDEASRCDVEMIPASKVRPRRVKDAKVCLTSSPSATGRSAAISCLVQSSLFMWTTGFFATVGRFHGLIWTILAASAARTDSAPSGR